MQTEAGPCVGLCFFNIFADRCHHWISKKEDIMARRNKPLNWFDKLYLVFLLVAVIMVPVMIVVREISDAQAEQYHGKFQSTVESYIADGTQVTGNKAVSLVKGRGSKEEAVYSTNYVPEQYTAKKPEEVRYLIRCEEGSTVVGYYSGGGVGSRLWVEVTVEDLKTGEILGEQYFSGGNPPQTISVKPGQSASRSGSAPSGTKIREWVLAALEGRLPSETTQEEAMQDTQPEMNEEIPETVAETVPEEYRKAMQIAEELLASTRGYGPVSLQKWMVDYEDCTEEEAAYAMEHCGANWATQALLSVQNNLGMKNYGFGPLTLEQSLQRDGFSSAQIEYALKNCDADWKAQALKLAIYHAESTGWSYSNMYRSLMSVYGFSEEEAKYGADNCNADWNKAAADHVRIFLEYSDEPYTREEMIREMVDRFGFTEEQAIYGVDQNGMK